MIPGYPAAAAMLIAIALASIVICGVPACAQSPLLLSTCEDDPSTLVVHGLLTCNDIAAASSSANICRAFPEAADLCPVACDSVSPACSEAAPGGDASVRLAHRFSDNGNVNIFLASTRPVLAFQFTAGCQASAAQPAFGRVFPGPLLDGFYIAAGEGNSTIRAAGTGRAGAAFGPGFGFLQEVEVDLNGCPADDFCINVASGGFLDAATNALDHCGECGNPCPPADDPKQATHAPEASDPGLGPVPAPTPASPDPHIKGFQGQEFDVTGVAGRFYSLVSDEALAINARFSEAFNSGSPAEGRASRPVASTGTWISDVGVITRSHRIQIHTDWSPFEGLCPPDPAEHDEACFKGGTVEVDDNIIVLPGPVVMPDGLNVTVLNFRSFGRVIVDDALFCIKVDYVPPPSSWAVAYEDYPTYSHLNIQIERINLGKTAHGLLGQTSTLRLDSRGAPIMASDDEDGQGVIEGAVTDYEVTSLMDVDFKYSRFMFSRRLSWS